MSTRCKAFADQKCRFMAEIGFSFKDHEQVLNQTACFGLLSNNTWVSVVSQ